MAEVLERLTAALSDRYRIERELGRGGMATVFLAEDLKHHRQVAIKVLQPELAAALGPERFLREIESTARLTHPHILPVHDSGSADGLLYYVMPYVRGESLRERLRCEPQLPVETALQIAREAADALGYAHQQGLIHRDVKPENILLEEGHAVLADFGIARAVESAGGEALTQTGFVAGTPLYMSPEQASGSGRLDGRSDLYSLACVLYEMLAGQPPFTGPTVESLTHQHLSVEPRSVTALRPRVPQPVDRVLTKALAKAPADRFGSATDFAAALAAGAIAPEHGPSRSRGRLIVAAAAVAVVALVAVAAWQRWGPLESWLGGAGHGPPAKKEWILVAEFGGPPDDSTLAPAVRDLVSAALDQSPTLATVPRSQVRLALEMAGKPVTTRVEVELARELAYRLQIRAVLDGNVSNLGRSYSVVLRVVDADSGRVVLTKSAAAKSRDDLIPTIGGLVRKLRAGLGENRRAMRATDAIPLTSAATPSFEAYKLMRRAGSLNDSGHPEAAIPLLREALALDPDFAGAWGTLGFAFGGTGQVDSALLAFDEALRRPRRLGRMQRFNIELVRALTDSDLPGALAVSERALAYDSTYARITNIALVFGEMGRFEDALETIRRAIRLNQGLVRPVVHMSEAQFLACLSRYDEARRVVYPIEGSRGQLMRASVELAACNWAGAESLAVAVAEGLVYPATDRWIAAVQLASAQAGRGALEAAAESYRRAEDVAADSPDPTALRLHARRGRMMLTIVTGGAIAIPAEEVLHETSASVLLNGGLRAALAGDRNEARRRLISARACSRRELADWTGPAALLEAQIAALAGDWPAAVRVLRPVALLPTRLSMVMYPTAMHEIRWFLADAFEKLAQPDSVAAYLEKITSDSAPTYRDEHIHGVAVTMAHRRLVMLYARMGRLEDAERHLALLQRMWARPGPIARRMLDEARGGVASARAMARPERTRT